MSSQPSICINPLFILLNNIIYIVITVAKYHSHTTLVTDTMVTKHYSHNFGHPHHNATYQFMLLATLIMVVARVRRRGDRPPTLNVCGVSGKYGETRNSCLLSVEKME